MCPNGLCYKQELTVQHRRGHLCLLWIIWGWSAHSANQEKEEIQLNPNRWTEIWRFQCKYTPDTQGYRKSDCIAERWTFTAYISHATSAQWTRSVSGFPLFLSIFPYLFRIFPFYICVDILSVFFVWLSFDYIGFIIHHLMVTKHHWWTQPMYSHALPCIAFYIPDPSIWHHCIIHLGTF